MKSNKKSKKYKYITGWINFTIPNEITSRYKHGGENIVAYISHVYLRKKDTPDLSGNKQKITLKVKQRRRQ